MVNAGTELQANRFDDESMLGSIVAALICVAIFVVAYGPFLTEQYAFAPSHDTTFLTTPMLCEIGTQLKAGYMPLLDWTTFEPESANLHLSVFYPLYLPTVLDYCTLKGGVAAHDVVGVLHLGLLFSFSVILGRATRLPWIGAVFAGAVISVSIDAISIARWPTLIAAAAWFHLAAAGLVLIVYRRHLFSGGLLVIVGTALLLAANPASNIMASLVVFSLFLTVGMVIQSIGQPDWRRLIRAWVLTALACGAAIALLSTGTTGNALFSLQDLIRWNRTGYAIGTNVPAEFAREILVEQRPAREILGLMIPIHIGALSFGVGGFYAGSIPVVLAALGAWERRKDPLCRTLAVMALLLPFFVFLDPANLTLAWRYVPGVSQVRHLSLFGGPFLIAVGILAGFGLCAMARSAPRRTGLIVGVVLLFLAAATAPLSRYAGGFDQATYVWPAVLACLLLGGALLLRAGLRLDAPILLVVVALVAWGLSIVGPLSSRRASLENGPTTARNWIDLQRLVRTVSESDPEPGIFLFSSSIKVDSDIYRSLDYTQAGTAARLLGRQTFQYFLSPRVFWQFFALNHLFPDYATYGRLGGRYVFTEGRENNALLEEIGHEGQYFAYRINGARGTVVPLCLGAEIPGQAPQRHARKSQLPLAPPPLLQAVHAADTSLPPCTDVDVKDIRIDRSADALRFTLLGQGASALVVNVPPHKGWILTVGGQQVPIYAVDDARSVAVLPTSVTGPAELRFRPLGVILRLWVTGVSWSVLIVVLTAVTLRRRDERRAGVRLEQSGRPRQDAPTAVTHMTSGR